MLSIWVIYANVQIKYGLVFVLNFANEDKAALTDVFIHDRDIDCLYETDGNFCKNEKKNIRENYFLSFFFNRVCFSIVFSLD